MAFVWYDWIIFITFLSSGIFISAFINYKSKNATGAQFLLAGKSLTWFPVTVSLFASFTSAITLISTPAEIYKNDIDYFWIVIPWLTGIVLTAHTFFRLFYKLNLGSAYDYLYRRYDSDLIRKSVSLIYLVFALISMGIALYAPSLSFSAAFIDENEDPENSNKENLLRIFVLLSGLISIAFCSIGGLKAVVWVDVAQAFIMIAVQITICIKSFHDAGGISKVWEYNSESHYANGTILSEPKIKAPNWKPDIYDANNFWNMVIYTICIWATFSINQIAMQRTLACKTMKHGQAALYMTWPINLTVIGVSCLIGLCLSVIYQSEDLVAAGKISSTDQLLTYYVASWPGWKGFLGLYCSALYSGAISNVSSCQAALSQITLNEFIRPFYKFKSERQTVLVSRILMVIYGVIAIILAFVASKLGDLLRPTLSIAATFVGPFMGIFIAGVFPFTTLRGVTLGGIIGFAITIWICVGQINYKPSEDGSITGLDSLYAISYLLLAPIGVVVSLVPGMLLSMVDRLLSERFGWDIFTPDAELVWASSTQNKYFRKDEGPSEFTNFSCPDEGINK